MPDDFEPFDEGPTHVDERTPVPEPVPTLKFNSLEHATGREAGFTEGVDRALAAIEQEVAGWEPSERVRLLNRLRTAALVAG